MIYLGNNKQIKDAKLGDKQVQSLYLGNGLVWENKYQYIQDGLIFQLDGIDKGPNEGAWTDLKGGIVFTNHGATALDNCWQFVYSQKDYMDSSTIIPTTNTCTVEVAYYSTRQSTFIIISGDRYNSHLAVYMVSASEILFMQNQKKASCNNSLNHNHVFSFNNTTKYFDLNTCETSTSTYYNNTAMTYIGKRNWGGGNYFNGKIYAIRVYNRSLTADEMLHNQQIDNVRFNLGLTLQ